jgi:hypothetical protein
MLKLAFEKASKAEEEGSKAGEEGSKAVSAKGQDKPKSAAPAFFLSVFVGFGTGQYYCGTNGTPFLLLDILGLTMTFVGVPAAISSQNFSDAAYFLVVGPFTFLFSRIWQIFDVFWAIDEARRAGRVAKVVPAIAVDVRRTSFDLGVSLKY